MNSSRNRTPAPTTNVSRHTARPNGHPSPPPRSPPQTPPAKHPAPLTDRDHDRQRVYPQRVNSPERAQVLILNPQRTVRDHVVATPFRPGFSRSHRQPCLTVHRCPGWWGFMPGPFPRSAQISQLLPHLYFCRPASATPLKTRIEPIPITAIVIFFIFPSSHPVSDRRWRSMADRRLYNGVQGRDTSPAQPHTRDSYVDRDNCPGRGPQSSSSTHANAASEASRAAHADRSAVKQVVRNGVARWRSSQEAIEQYGKCLFRPDWYRQRVVYGTQADPEI